METKCCKRANIETTIKQQGSDMIGGQRPEKNTPET